MSDQTDAPMAVPLLEQLRSVPRDWREVRQVGEFSHRFVPYGIMLHDAADRIAQLERELAEAHKLAALQQGLVDERADLRREYEAKLAAKDEPRTELDLARHNLREMHALLAQRQEFDQVQARKIDALEQDLGQAAAKLRAAELEIERLNQVILGFRGKGPL